jgi:very-short-patch-repair endonuclease
MSSLSVFDFEGNTVRFVGTVDKPEWVAQDVCKVLEVKNVSDAIERLDDYQKGLRTVQTHCGKQKLLTVTLDGLKALVTTSRSPRAKVLAKALGFDVYVSPIEADCLSVLEAAFSDSTPIRQYSVQSYRIDLYLERWGIAIECDEYGHKSIDKSLEANRQLAIEKILGCVFVRFNPHSSGFNIGCVISEIREIELSCRELNNLVNDASFLLTNVTKAGEFNYASDIAEKIWQANHDRDANLMKNQILRLREFTGF